MESGTHEDLLSKPESKYGEFYAASLGRVSDEAGKESSTESSAEEDLAALNAFADLVIAEEGDDADEEGSGAEESEGEVSEAASSNDYQPPMMMHISWLGDRDENPGESPESFTRFEEIHDGSKEQEVLKDIVEEGEEDEEDDDDSGFEGSSQSSVCPEDLPAHIPSGISIHKPTP